MTARRILVVGAGFAGAVYARSFADAGHIVTVIDKRDHLAGNAFDYVDNNGIRSHKYGPHLFHTKMIRVSGWLKAFGEFLPYCHKVRAKVAENFFVPLPLNRTSPSMVFDRSLSDEESAKACLEERRLPLERPAANAAEYFTPRSVLNSPNYSFARTQKRCGTCAWKTSPRPSSSGYRLGSRRMILILIPRKNRCFRVTATQPFSSQ